MYIYGYSIACDPTYTYIMYNCIYTYYINSSSSLSLSQQQSVAKRHHLKKIQEVWGSFWSLLLGRGATPGQTHMNVYIYIYIILCIVYIYLYIYICIDDIHLNKYAQIFLYIPGSAFTTFFWCLAKKRLFKRSSSKRRFFSETPKNVILMLVAATWRIHTLPSLAFSISFL